MKSVMNKLVRDEKGAALILALILLLVAGLIAASLLGYMGSGLLVGKVYDTRTAELYAADAGVEDALWRIQNHVPEVAGLTQCNQYWSYNITDAYGGVAEVNDKRVDVTITLVNNVTFTYRVVSTATGDGSGTKVDAYVIGTSEYDDYSGLLDQVLTSQGQFYCPNPPTPCTCTELAELVDPGCGDENGPEPNYDGAWPDQPDELEKFAEFYWQQVKNKTHYASPINLDGNDITLNGGYLDDTLTIVTNSKQGEESVPVLKLEGTLYITGNAQINPTQEMILDLNKQTIFVESSSIKSVDGEYALWIGAGGGGENTKLKMKGPGIIIAVGDIYFAPGELLGGEDYPIFIFSVLGTSLLQPGGDFYGAIAGSVQVELKSNNEVSYPEGSFDDYGLNFPGLSEVELVYSITSWEINQQ